jgi:hypothetical protein
MASCQVTVAVNPHDDSQIYGYIVSEIKDGILVIHYVYVKHTFRKIGIAKEMLDSVRKDGSVAALYSHGTMVGDRIAPRYNLVYHPYVALTPDYRSNPIEEDQNEEETE